MSKDEENELYWLQYMWQIVLFANILVVSTFKQRESFLDKKNMGIVYLITCYQTVKERCCLGGVINNLFNAQECVHELFAILEG